MGGDVSRYKNSPLGDKIDSAIKVVSLERMISVSTSPSSFQLTTLLCSVNSEASSRPTFKSSVGFETLSKGSSVERLLILTLSLIPARFTGPNLKLTAFATSLRVGMTSNKSKTPSPSESVLFAGLFGNGSTRSGSPSLSLSNCDSSGWSSVMSGMPSLSSSESPLLPTPSPSVSTDSEGSSGSQS